MKPDVRNRLLVAAAAGCAIAIAIALGQGLFGGAGPDKKNASAKPLPLVSVTTSRAVDLPVKFVAQGHFVPLNQVDVRPQVTGTIRGVHFREGDQIERGQLLFTLDASDANAQLNRVQAQAAQVKAQLDDARREYERSKRLVKSNFISSSAVDSAASKVESFQAQLKAAEAEAESARVQTGYTRITAPISGQAGALAVHPGSLAQLGAATPLLTLVQFDPIAVDFNLPEQNLSALLAARAAGDVKIVVDTSDAHTTEGSLSFINNTVDTQTGTISLKGAFPNPKRILWPGSFVRVTLYAGTSKGAIVLPPQALLEGPKGNFVYLIDNEGKVASKPVTLLRMQDENAVIEGLKSGERVVLEGNQNLRSGMTAKVVADPAEAQNSEILASGASK